MKLTGQASIKFEEWYRINDNEFCVGYPNGDDDDNMCEDFYDLPNSYQYGVYVDFFDSVEVFIEVARYNILNKFYCMLNDSSYKPDIYITRNEARREAIVRANEILNRQLTE